MSRPPIMICETCQEALTLVGIEEEGGQYVHGGSKPRDHEVVPVQAPPGWVGQCDFCAADMGTFVLPAGDFQDPNNPNRWSRGGWAACEACARLIEAGHWALLLVRVAEVFKQQHGQRMDLGQVLHLWGLHQALREAVDGPLRRVGGDDQ